MKNERFQAKVRFDLETCKSKSTTTQPPYPRPLGIIRTPNFISFTVDIFLSICILQVCLSVTGQITVYENRQWGRCFIFIYWTSLLRFLLIAFSLPFFFFFFKCIYFPELLYPNRWPIAFPFLRTVNPRKPQDGPKVEESIKCGLRRCYSKQGGSGIEFSG